MNTTTTAPTAARITARPIGARPVISQVQDDIARQQQQHAAVRLAMAAASQQWKLQQQFLG